MNLTERGKTYLSIALLSFAFTYLIITINGFPYFGIFLSFVFFLIFTYKLKINKTNDSKLYFAFSLIFSTLIFIRSEPELTLINIMASLFFGMLMLCADLNVKAGFLDYIYSPFIFLVRTIFTKNSDYYLEYKYSGRVSNKNNISKTILGVLLTLALITVVIPLLSSVNPIFQKGVENIWKFLNFEYFINAVGVKYIVVWIFRLIIFLILIFIIPKILTILNKKNDYQIPFIGLLNKLPLFLPKLSLAVILLIFFITQLQYYFAGDTALAEMGISHSERTREVFAQLTVVAGIIIVLIYNAGKNGLSGIVLNWILGTQGIFLTLMAFKSVFDYINAWGFTYKRLYGLTFTTWIVGILILLFINMRKGYAHTWFVKKTVIYSSALLILVNIFNFDYLIYHFRKSATGQGVDYTYLSTLSPDSLSYDEQFYKLKNMTLTFEYDQNVYDNKNPLILLNKIKYIQEKYRNLDFRTFNILEYFQYRQILSINVEELFTFYNYKLNPRL